MQKLLLFFARISREHFSVKSYIKKLTIMTSYTMYDVKYLRPFVIKLAYYM